ANRAVDRVERVGNREVADAAVGDGRAAGELRLRERSVDGRGQRGAAAAAHVAEEPLQDAEAGVAGHLQRDPILIQIDRSRDAQLRVLAHQLQIVDPYLLTIERDTDRRAVADGVVEQPDL